jgi:hypothetical protein
LKHVLAKLKQNPHRDLIVRVIVSADCFHDPGKILLDEIIVREHKAF